MKLVNLTPHPVQIWDVDKNVIVIPAELMPARCIEKVYDRKLIKADFNYSDGNDVQVVKLSYTDVSYLPDPEDNVMYIVSVLVAQARPDRDDLLVPYDLVRNDNGSIMGCRALAKIK